MGISTLVGVSCIYFFNEQRSLLTSWAVRSHQPASRYELSYACDEGELTLDFLAGGLISGLTMNEVHTVEAGSLGLLGYPGIGDLSLDRPVNQDFGGNKPCLFLR